MVIASGEAVVGDSCRVNSASERRPCMSPVPVKVVEEMEGVRGFISDGCVCVCVGGGGGGVLRQQKVVLLRSLRHLYSRLVYLLY
ncbi:hypothetical protein Hanom_Chr03g00251071 [Helianthus anomalus]